MRIKFKSIIIKEFMPLIIVTSIAFLILPVTGVSVHNNTAMWLKTARSALHKQDTMITSHDFLSARRPLLPMIIASGFKLWGKNVHSASLATRIFFALEIILIYLLGRVLYSRAVGLLSCGLVLTSYGINFIASFIETDIVLPFFILLFILNYYIALIRSSRLLAVFAAISLGLAILVKESALFCLGLPLGMIVLAPKGKRRKYAELALWFFGILIIPLVLWAIYLFLTKKNFRSLAEAVRFQFESIKIKIIAIDRTPAYWINLFTSGFPKALFKFYQTYLEKVTHLNLLMILGWFFVFFRGLISKKIPDLILTVLMICSLPLVLRTSDTSDRLGQTTFTYMLLYIALAAFVVSIISFLLRYVLKLTNKYERLNIFHQGFKKYPALICSLFILFVGLFLIKIQLFGKYDSTWKLWTESKYSLSVFSKKPFKVYDRYTTEQQEAAEWLKKNAPKNSKIIADGYTNEAMDFFEVADYQIPLFHPAPGISVSQGYIPKIYDNARPLYLITYSNFDSGSPRHRSIWPIFEEDIVAALNREKPDYLIISGRGLFFSAYFDKAKWACLKFDNQLVRIYEIHLERFEPVAFGNVGVNESINEHLIWLETNYPDEYSSLKKMLESVGLTVDELKNSPLRFPRGKVY